MRITGMGIVTAQIKMLVIFFKKLHGPITASTHVKRARVWTDHSVQSVCLMRDPIKKHNHTATITDIMEK